MTSQSSSSTDLPSSSSSGDLPEWGTLLIAAVVIAVILFLFIRFFILPLAHCVDNVWPSRWSCVTRPRKVHAIQGRGGSSSNAKTKKQKKKHNHRPMTPLEELGAAVRTATPLGRATAAVEKLSKKKLTPAESDKECLTNFFEATHGSNPKVSVDWERESGGGGRNGWLDDTVPIAMWQGISHDGKQNGRVTALSLPKNKIYGELTALRTLVGLEKLNLRNNFLYGPLSAIHPMVALKKLNLSNNGLGGDLQPLAGLFELVDLDLTNNRFVSDFVVCSLPPGAACAEPG
jgi:hypothetical protein